MSLFKKYSKCGDLTAEGIAELANQFKGSVDLDAMLELKEYIINNLRVSATKLAIGSGGKKISVVLNSVLNDLCYLKVGDTVFLEKYLIDNSNPTVTGSFNVPAADIDDTLSREMVELFNSAGIYNTALFYLLVIYHMGK